MSLVFLGDIASPNDKCSQDLRRSLKEVSFLFAGNDTVINLEGLLSNDTIAAETPILYNHPSVVPVLEEINTRVVSLSNNHTLDLPQQLGHTVEKLKEHGVRACGSGVTRTEAEAPAVFTSGDREVLIYGFCWDILMQHQENREGVCYVNPLKPKRALAIVNAARAEQPEAVIVLKMHWSLDLEKLPFPLYRQLSMDLIEAGANAVIGCHSHCVQGGERHKNGIIVYGLGNFFVPWYTFINETIHFPAFAREEMALEWNPESGEATCHWFHYENAEQDHRLIYEGGDDFDTSPRLRKHSGYYGMTAAAYLPWFKRHRRKRLLLPVYRDYNQTFRNEMIDRYLKARIRFARFLARTGLRGWNN